MRDGATSDGPTSHGRRFHASWMLAALLVPAGWVLARHVLFRSTGSGIEGRALEAGFAWILLAHLPILLSPARTRMKFRLSALALAAVALAFLVLPRIAPGDEDPKALDILAGAFSLLSVVLFLTAPYRRWIAPALMVCLMVLHQDFWWWDDATTLFGFLPVGLLWHAALSVTAGAVGLIAVTHSWPGHLDVEEGP